MLSTTIHESTRGHGISTVLHHHPRPPLPRVPCPGLLCSHQGWQPRQLRALGPLGYSVIWIVCLGSPKVCVLGSSEWALKGSCTLKKWVLARVRGWAMGVLSSEEICILLQGPQVNSKPGYWSPLAPVSTFALFLTHDPCQGSFCCAILWLRVLYQQQNRWDHPVLQVQNCELSKLLPSLEVQVFCYSNKRWASLLCNALPFPVLVFLCPLCSS